MSISAKILQFVWLGVVLLCLIITIQVLYGQHASRLLKSERIADNVVQEISSLLIIVDEFEDRKNIRLFQVWQRRFDHLSESLVDHPELYRQIENDLKLLHLLINELYHIESRRPLSVPSTEQLEIRTRKENFISNRNDIAIRRILSRSIRYSKQVSQRQERILRNTQVVQIGLIIVCISLFVIAVLWFFSRLSDSFKSLSQKITLTPPVTESAILSGQSEPFRFREFNTILDNFHDLLQRIYQVNLELMDNRAKLEMAADRERAWVASELHDNITQLLGMAKMQLNNLAVEAPAMQDHQRFQKAQMLLMQATEDLRRLTHRIMPASIKDFGIVLSVQELLSEIENANDIHTELIYDNDVRLNDEKELNVFRIIQEAVANTVKHGRASHLKVTLRFGESTLLVRVADDGIGFSSEEKPLGIGLRTMHNRASRIRGKLNISSGDEGTLVELYVPTK
jgi:signal transduction histidine kinase